MAEYFKNNKSKRLEIRMTPEEAQNLEECAELMHVHRTDVLNMGVRLVRERLSASGRKKAVEESFAMRVEQAANLARQIASIQLALFHALYEKPTQSKAEYADAFAALNDMTTDLKSDLRALTDDIFARKRAEILSLQIDGGGNMKS